MSPQYLASPAAEAEQPLPPSLLLALRRARLTQPSLEEQQQQQEVSCVLPHCPCPGDTG